MRSTCDSHGYGRSTSAASRTARSGIRRRARPDDVRGIEDRRMNGYRLIGFVAAATFVAASAFAQADFTGKWRTRNGQDVMERGFGPELVNYLGLPLNDQGRARALSYNYAALSLP